MSLSLPEASLETRKFCLVVMKSWVVKGQVSPNQPRRSALISKKVFLEKNFRVLITFLVLGAGYEVALIYSWICILNKIP